MQIFEIGQLMEAITQAIGEGTEPDPAMVELLCQEGPSAVEQWVDSIANIEAESEAIKLRISELKERKDSRDHAVERMKGALQDVMNRHFNGKIKTPLVTVWTQKTATYDVVANPTDHPTCFKIPDPVLKKKEVIEAYKNGSLPDGVIVTEGFSESVRVKHT